ncbi:MAG: cobalamin-dependent protein [Desulfobacteraceae bacterium]|jgi:methanogenic corrinoid protein MtbC1
MNRPSEANGFNRRLERMKGMIIELQEEASLAELRKMLDAGVDPKLLLDAFMAAMHQVGIRFENGSYFIAALIMAGEIMRGATELLSPYLADQKADHSSGRIVLGTVRGDIHDLGKNLFAILLKCHGIEVMDLGVDVPAEVFLEQSRKLQPDIVGISCVMTTSIDNLKQAIDMFKQQSPQTDLPIVVGGTCIDEQIAHYVDAAFWTNDATAGLRICQEILQAKGCNKSGPPG